MTWLDNLAAAIPPPHPDEPPELRGQIVKELRDHLECAFHRELVKSGNADEAIRRVVASFGNPQRVARQLWYDAMKEKIMSQRILIGLLVFLVIVCTAMGTMTLRLALQMADQNRQTQQALLVTLDRLLANSENQKSLNWVEARIKLVQNVAGGKPAVGYDVWFCNEQANGSAVNINGTTDAEGQLDLGWLVPSVYGVTIKAPWGEQTNQTIYIRAGRLAQTLEIVCPAADVEETPITFDVDWPEELRDKNVGLMFSLKDPPGRSFGDNYWQPPFQADSGRRFILTRDGVLIRSPTDWAGNDWYENTRWIKFEGLSAEPAATLRRRGTSHTVQVIGVVVLNDFGRCGFVSKNDQRTPCMRVLVGEANNNDQPTEFGLTGVVEPGRAGQRVVLPVPYGIVSRLRGKTNVPLGQGVSMTVPIWWDGKSDLESPFGPPAGGYYQSASESPPSSDNAPTQAPQNDVRSPEEAEKLAQQGLQLQQAGQLDKALEAYTEAIRLDPASMHAFSFRSSLWAEKKEWDKALEDCELAICYAQGATSMADRYWDEAQILRQVGRVEGALHAYARAVQFLPDETHLLNRRASQWIASGFLPKVLYECETPVQNASEYGGVFNQVAWLLATLPDSKLRNGQQAREWAGKACDATGWSDWSCIATLAAACAENGEFELATQWETRSIEMAHRTKDEGNDPDKREQSIKRQQQRLALFQSGHPYREEPSETEP